VMETCKNIIQKLKKNSLMCKKQSKLIQSFVKEVVCL